MRLTWLTVSVCALPVSFLAAAGPAMARPSCGTVEVVDPQGRPLAGTEVAYYDYDPRETLQRGSGPEPWTTNAAGRVCEEAFLEPGFLEVHAPKPLGGWCVANEVVPYRGWRASAPVTRVHLHLKRIHRSRLHVRVVAGDGKPVAGASIFLARIYPKDTQCSEVIVPNEQRQEDIRLPAGLTLAGQVVTKTGQPAAGAWVIAISTDRERSSWEGRLEVQADGSGRFTFHHLAAGQWRVVTDSVVTAKPQDWQTVTAGAIDLKLVTRKRR
jgi:hypothetical protein